MIKSHESIFEESLHYKIKVFQTYQHRQYRNKKLNIDI